MSKPNLATDVAALLTDDQSPVGQAFIEAVAAAVNNLSLADLKDVSIDDPTNQQALAYEATAELWVPTDLGSIKPFSVSAVQAGEGDVNAVQPSSSAQVGDLAVLIGAHTGGGRTGPTGWDQLYNPLQLGTSYYGNAVAVWTKKLTETDLTTPITVSGGLSCWGIFYMHTAQLLNNGDQKTGARGATIVADAFTASPTAPQLLIAFWCTVGARPVAAIPDGSLITITRTSTVTFIAGVYTSDTAATAIGNTDADWGTVRIPIVI